MHIITDFHVEAAQCLWEHVSEERTQNDELNKYFEEHGASAVRSECRHFPLIDAITKGWEIAYRDGQGYEEPFDWEFVPWFFDTCTTFATTQSFQIKNNWQELCLALGK